ncbi:MAG: [Bacteroidales bacterium]|nr:[FeFe] hydrogenase H-cluster radical SAM maturase HydG [Bacteroidales bacterium]
MYNPTSSHADDFINHDEILESLAEASRESGNHARVLEILEKAAKCKGITHREAAILMACNDPEIEESIYNLASEIKHKFYGNRIVLFAPLYLSNYCVNG